MLRGQRVLLDADLAVLYGVPTKALNQAVRRNEGRFPADFCFRISEVEKREVVTICDHLQRLKYSRTTPLAFTEHGAIMAATVLNSPRAVAMSVYVATLDASTHRQFEEVYEAIRALMAPPDVKSRPIGFTADIE